MATPPPSTPESAPTPRPAVPPSAACRGCGYPLHGLSADRCPECGRPFDPADRRTMSLGRRPGFLARRLLTPTGWPTRLAFVVATAAVAFATRPQIGPIGQWDLAPVDLRLDTALLAQDVVRTPTDVAYAVGLWLWTLGLAWLAARTILRPATRWWYDAAAPSDTPSPDGLASDPGEAPSTDGHLRSRDRTGVEASRGSVLANSAKATATKSSSDLERPLREGPLEGEFRPAAWEVGATSPSNPTSPRERPRTDSTPGPPGRSLVQRTSTPPLPDGHGSLNARPAKGLGARASGTSSTQVGRICTWVARTCTRVRGLLRRERHEHEYMSVPPQIIPHGRTSRNTTDNDRPTRARPSIRPNRPTAAAFVAFCGLALFTGVCVLVGWPYRIGQHDADAYVPGVLSGMFATGRAGESQASEELRFARERRIFSAGVHQSASARLRTAALARMAEEWPGGIGEAAREGVARETDPSVLEWHIRLLGLVRDPAVVSTARNFLRHDDVRLRVAALDAIAAAEDPELNGTRLWHLDLASQPPIPLFQVVPPTGLEDLNSDASVHHGSLTPFVLMPSDIREAVGLRMVGGVDTAEREAAARASQAMRGFGPADGRLRLAEWGVWVGTTNDGTPGGLAAGQEVLRGIPPFVHQYGDPASQISPLPVTSRGGPWVVSKPVIHFEADLPTALKLWAEIRRGRVEYAYPKPDDYSIAGPARFALLPAAQLPLTAFDHPSQARFKDRRSLLPWISTSPPSAPRLGQIPPFAPTFHVPADSIGFRWDTLIVTPDRRPWMSPPAVPPDPAYAWWLRLRDVPCSWVSSRGEAERFLYYDGPTLLPPPVRVRSAGAGRLSIEATDDPRATGEDDRVDVAAAAGLDAMSQTARKGRRRERRGMWVEVRPDGGVSAERLPVPWAGESAAGKPERPAMAEDGPGAALVPPAWATRPTPFPASLAASTSPTPTSVTRGQVWWAPSDPPGRATYGLGTGPQLAGPAVEAELRAWVVDAGLTGPEADGMMAAWREAFFAKPGRRFVLLLSAVDYDSLCPMQVRPTPTESARVGLVWTELPGAGGAGL